MRKLDNVTQKLEAISKRFDAIERRLGAHNNAIGELREDNYNGFEALSTKLNKNTAWIDERFKHPEVNWHPKKGRTYCHTRHI